MNFITGRGTNVKIVTAENPILHKKTNVNPNMDDNLAVAKQIQTFLFRNTHAAGLAANQLGLDFSVFGCKFGTMVRLFINPTVDAQYAKQQETTVESEGCLSIPGKTFMVPRPKSVRITYTNMKGERITEIFEGKQARIVQHEYDHLQGKLIGRKTYGI